MIIGSQQREGLISPVWESGDTDTWAPSGATFVTRGPWSGSLVFTGLAGESLYRLIFDPDDPTRPRTLERYLVHQYGRLRDVAEGPDGALYLITSNRDGYGDAGTEDDRLLRVIVR
jgi:glucose/arabinose dehydrogenase